jgi:DNA-directed RNA polymerase subunit RPC12/RpoP
MCVPLRRIHQPVETFHYRCNFCPKRFPHVSLLNIHERVHTGEKPYQCMDCGQCFGSQSSLIKHNRSVGQLAPSVFESGEKPYQCMDCGQCFGSQSSLIKHNRSVRSASSADLLKFRIRGETLPVHGLRTVLRLSVLPHQTQQVSWSARSADLLMFRIRGETLPVHGLRPVLRLPVLPHQAQQVS